MSLVSMASVAVARDLSHAGQPLNNSATARGLVAALEGGMGQVRHTTYPAAVRYRRGGDSGLLVKYPSA